MNVADHEFDAEQRIQRIKRRKERVWKAKRSHRSLKPSKKYDGKHRRRIPDISW